MTNTNSREQLHAAIDRLDNELAERLVAVNEKLAAAEAEVEAIKQERVGVIGEAIEARWSHQRIGVVLGLSKQRIAQLVKGK